MSGVYDHPEYYDIAFDFRDIPAEVDIFEACFERFARTKVKSVLELGCGNCPHMAEFVRRGYRYFGLDNNAAMIRYGREKAVRVGEDAQLVQADMNDFRMDSKVEFVYVLVGSLGASNNKEMDSHFESVASVLQKGGLYLLDWCIRFETPFEKEGGESWEMERGDIKVKSTCQWKAISRVEQTFEDKLILEVDNRGKKYRFEEATIRQAIYPQEFLRLVSGLKEFEFVGWWNNWDIDQPLEQATSIDRPIAIIRRL